jgi:hypothetical protein
MESAFDAEKRHTMFHKQGNSGELASSTRVTFNTITSGGESSSGGL